MPNLLFDLDGTLVNSQPGIEYAFRLAVADVLSDRADELGKVTNLIGPPVPVMFQQAFPALSEPLLARLVSTFRYYYDEAGGWQKTMVYDGVAAGLQQLKNAGLRCFIVTNKPALATSRILDALALTQFFERITSPDSLTGHLFSSKVELVSYLLQTYDLESSQTYLVGDSTDDAQAASQNGLGFFAAAYGYGQIDPPQSQLGTLNQFSDLLQFIVTESAKTFI